MGDEIMLRVARLRSPALRADLQESRWDESEHPRAPDGKFGSGSGKGDGGAKDDLASKLPKGLGIPRAAMPQIKSKYVPEFLDGLRGDGVKVERKEQKVGDLRPSQGEFNSEKLKSLEAAGVTADAKPIMASKDGYIIDGHHRWAGLYLANPEQKIDTYHIDLPAKELIAKANAFGKATHQTIAETGSTPDVSPARVKEHLLSPDGVDLTPKRTWVNEVPAGMKKESWMGNMTANPDGHPDAKPTPERQPLHDAIKAHFLDKVEAPPMDQRPIAILTMGGPASGKSSMMAGLDRSQFVTVDPDEIKGMIPEYKQATNPAATYRGAAFMVHEESSYLGKQIRAEAVAQRKNIILDGTGADADKFVKTINEMKAKGYQVHVMMPELEVATARERADERAEKTGRSVPQGRYVVNGKMEGDFLGEAYAKIPRNFHRIAAAADQAALFDANRSQEMPGGKKGPILAWSKNEHGETVHDPAFMEKFNKKYGAPPASAEKRAAPSDAQRPAVDGYSLRAAMQAAMGAELEALASLPKRFDVAAGECIDDCPNDDGDL